MNFIPVARPQMGAELAVMLSLLEANNIPAYVQNGGMGGLFPGLEIDNVTTRYIMVPEECADDARVILNVMEQPADSEADDTPPAPARTSVSDKLRMLIEFLVTGLFVPGHRRSKSRDKT